MCFSLIYLWLPLQVDGYTETHVERDALALRKLVNHVIRLRKRSTKQRDKKVHQLCDYLSES